LFFELSSTEAKYENPYLVVRLHMKSHTRAPRKKAIKRR